MLLDGRVVALEADSGQVLWTFASGSPLLSSQQSGLAKLARMAVFPGVDGGLYAYHGTEGANAKLEVGGVTTGGRRKGAHVPRGAAAHTDPLLA